MSPRRACAWRRRLHAQRRLTRTHTRCRRRPGGYSDSSAANDFSPYKFWKRTSNASLKKVGSKTYLALRMKKGCYGTGGRGCGMYGRLPLNNVKRVKTATLEYTCGANCAALHVPPAVRRVQLGGLSESGALDLDPRGMHSRCKRARLQGAFWRRLQLGARRQAAGPVRRQLHHRLQEPFHQGLLRAHDVD